MQFSHVMLWPHGKSVACAGAAMQMQHPSSPPSSAPPPAAALADSAAPRRRSPDFSPRVAPACVLPDSPPEATAAAAAPPLVAVPPGAPELPWRQKRCWCPSWPQLRQKKTRQPRFEHW